MQIKLVFLFWVGYSYITDTANQTENKMYDVNGTKFDSYLAAVAHARSIDADVYEMREGGESIRRWTPAAKPTAKKMRMYRERQAAYDAQQKQNS